MKINRLEAHDRLGFFKEDQSVNVFKGAEDCLKENWLSLFLQEHSPYIYMYAHPRTLENGDKALYWQPRLSRPKSSTNAYLFKAKSKTDLIEVCWLIPPMEIWPQYVKGMLFEDPIITWSIDQFKTKKAKLDASEQDDLPEHRMREIYLLLKADLESKRKPLPTIEDGKLDLNG
jgi:hypothetical protein